MENIQDEWKKVNKKKMGKIFHALQALEHKLYSFT